MHTIEHNHMTGKSVVGYYFGSAEHDEFIDVATCDNYRAAAAFCSYLNGGSAPDADVWQYIQFPDGSGEAT